MNLKAVFIACLALCLIGCAKYAPGHNFTTAAITLKEDYDYWLSHGRPVGFQPSEIGGLPEEYFVFTNAVKTTRGVLHCRFGCRLIGWPAGVLAITDDRVVIFIRQRDGKVIFSPEVNGVYY
ncbi:MAG TPA: hypothetical protein VMF08_09685 [Candidatus Sulfotelmatobacter sp.]|nr:hypothetical protein [Candidatus Sulfotelmatobacter sp.]